MEESRRPREKGAPQLPPTPTDAPTVDQAFVNDLRVQLLNQQVELQNRPQQAAAPRSAPSLRPILKLIRFRSKKLRRWRRSSAGSPMICSSC